MDDITTSGESAESGAAGQHEDRRHGVSRRAVVRAGVVGGTALGIGAAYLVPAGAATKPAAPARGAAPRTRDARDIHPACTPGSVTDSNLEGPYFEPGSPQQSDLTAGVTGVLLTLTGTVSDPNCVSVGAALLDFWQCDSNGVYDNTGYTLRGHQYTDGAGDFSLATIIPASYTDDTGTRTPHIHVKVQAPNGPILTTQLFFPDATQAYGLDFASLNAQDMLFDPSCFITEQQQADGSYTGTFDFVIATS